MLKKILIFIFIINIILFGSLSSVEANRQCTTLSPSDNNTFKEYCYKITDAYLSLQKEYKVNGKINSYLAGRILNYGKQGLNYLPDDLINKNFYTRLQTAIEKGIKEPTVNSNFDAISSAIDDFLTKTNISEISGDIEVIPASGNAPLTVTLRSNVKEPTGTKLENYNYSWWISDKGKKKVVGSGPYLNYTFIEEGNYSIFLDVTSNHKNSSGNSDVIPFSKKVEIQVKEKVASLMVKVNSKTLDATDELKFSPDDSIYGLIFDATSSVPTSGTKFIKTTWDFGNGVKKSYESAPKIERVVYANEGDYKVTLVLETNTGRSVERVFNIIVRNPISTINASALEGFMGDKFTFTANSYSRNENLTYSWEIVDLKNDKILFNKSLTTFNYTFPEKGRYNVKLTVTSANGQKDYDNKIIHINSRPPVAAFTSTILNSSKPNTVYLDATTSYDLDLSDDGKLEFSWIINGERVELDNANFNGSTGNYTFSEVGEQSITLEVRDQDDLLSQLNKKISISSVLSLDFFIFPRVSQVGNDVKLVAESPKAKFYEWNFGDGTKVGGEETSVSHKYKEAGTYSITLTVRDENDYENKISKIIYVGDANSPVANIYVGSGSNQEYEFKEGVCNGKGAYIVNKVDSITLSGDDSIDVTGLNGGLTYSWKVGEKFFASRQITQKFDDIGCFPVKLTVKSQKSGAENSIETYLKVENVKPTLTGLNVGVKDISSDPVIVDVSSMGAIDKDGVIQSYLWYYFTDTSSEPQDFRATKTPQTTFVLPRITGTYYFVVVLKDNNEEIFSSEELSGKYYVTLTGDNLNTPLINLSANNTSVKTGEEVIFTANVSNILGQNLNNNKDVKYSWDFDGDGFYDQETTKNVVSYKFKNSGEKRVKLKVKNKGFSNTKSIVINVSNILKPEFEFVSIGNTYLFFDKSEGSADRYSWDMGDGNIVDKKGSFTYTYTDSKPVHLVKLTLEEGGNKKEVTKKITRDFQKMMDDRKQTLGIFSNYAINNDKIIFKEEVSNLQFFVRTSLPTVKNYGVDYNIEVDSDLNGGKDDDEDNKDLPSYSSGGPILIELNDSRTQKIKIFLKDEQGKVLESKIITIEKEYIENKVVDFEKIKLEGVSNSVKNTFEKIKLEIEKLDPENRQKSLSYLQRLQEDWGDDREKTNIIIEFSGFISELNSPNSEEIVNLLEGLLVEDKEDKSENAIVLSALQKVIPKDITCTGNLVAEAESKKISCYDLLYQKLETISKNNNLEENKTIGKEILSVISENKTMSNQEKMDFKGFLSKLIEKGQPSEETKQEAETTTPAPTQESSGMGGIFLTILKIIGGVIIIGIILGGIVFLINYLKNKRNNPDESFEQYVEKTSNNDVLAEEKTEVIKKDDFDPLAENENISKSVEKEQVPDWLKGNFSENETKTEKKEEAKIENTGDVPDWLKGAETSVQNNSEFSFEETKTEEKIEENNSSENTGEVPDWLKGTEVKSEFEETEKTENNSDNSDDVPDWLKSTESTEEKIEENNSLENTGEVPDWLKGAETKEEFEETEKIENNSDNSDDVPDWLKSTESTEEKTEEKTEENNSLENTGEVPDWLKSAETKEEFEETEKTENNSDNSDDVPDWLKSAESTEEKTEENSEINNSENEVEIPDWLKVSEVKNEFEEIQEKAEEFVVEKTEEIKEKISEVPDWLQTPDNSENTLTFEEKPKLETKEELDEFTKIKVEDDEPKKEDNLPDWLKGSASIISEEKTEKEVNPRKSDDFATFDSIPETKEEKTTEKKSSKPKRKSSKKTTEKKVENEEKTEEVQTKTTKKEDELWDDGMKIPDWLKSDSDK